MELEMRRGNDYVNFINYVVKKRGKLINNFSKYAPCNNL